jgi:hypothetical protein
MEEPASYWSVCADHSDDPAVQAFIATNASEDSCSVCGETRAQPFAVVFDDLVEFVRAGIESEWGRADDEGIPYDTGEGGYQVAHPIDTYDLLGGETDLSPVNHGGLHAALSDAIGAQLWVQRDFWEFSPEDRLKVGWREFCRVVKHERRYFFNNDPNPEIAPPAELLELIARTAEKDGLIRTLPTEVAIFRARTHQASERPSSAAELGAPPTERALSANRMSPAGISMFY